MSIELHPRMLTRNPLDPETEVVVAVPAVYLDYVRGRLPVDNGNSGYRMHKLMYVCK